METTSADIDSTHIWVVLRRSVPSGERAMATASPAEGEEKKKRPWETLGWRVFFGLADLCAAVAWVYIILKLFVVDIDEVIIDATLPAASWVLGYKLILLIGGVVVISLVLWRFPTLVFMAYLAFFPFIVVFWKLPWFIAKRRSWAFVMASVHTAINFVRNLRYNLVSKGLWLIAAFGVFAFKNDVLIGLSAVTLMALMGWSVGRSIRDSFRPNWFLAIQEKAIGGIVGSSFLKSTTTLTAAELPANDQVILTKEQVTSVVTKIQYAAIANRLIYFWAYRLQQYKQSQMAIILNGIAYTAVFVGCALSFGLANLALLEIDPEQYQFESFPSRISMITYGMSTLFWGSFGTVSARGDMAHILGLVAGLFGPIFLTIFLVNVVFVSRREQDDTTLSETVAGLRRQAREHEAEFRTGLSVTVAEACSRLSELGVFSLVSFYDRLIRDIPDEFLRDDQPA